MLQKVTLSVTGIYHSIHTSEKDEWLCNLCGFNIEKIFHNQQTKTKQTFANLFFLNLKSGLCSSAISIHTGIVLPLKFNQSLTEHVLKDEVFRFIFWSWTWATRSMFSVNKCTGWVQLSKLSYLVNTRTKHEHLSWIPFFISCGAEGPGWEILEVCLAVIYGPYTGEYTPVGGPYTGTLTRQVHA